VGRRVFAIIMCSAAAGTVARAQVVSGRVANEAGVGVPHVRVVAFPVSDSSEAATRVVVTNDAGNFRLRLGGPAKYVVRVRRIGFTPEADQIIDATQANELQLTMTLRAFAIELPSVKVTAQTSAPRCLAMDDTLQDPQVREWVDHALDVMRTRRLVERDFAFQVNVQSSRIGAMTFTHDPYLRADGWMEDDPANLAGVARALTRSGTDVFPTEISLITPIFRAEYCFSNALSRVEDGWTVQFRNKENQSGDLSTSGWITFAPNGLDISRVDFEFRVGKDLQANAHLGFAPVTIEGETYPAIVSRSISRAATRKSPRAIRIEETVAYTAFKRARGSSPLRPLRLPPGS
jgi:hypothetical protein